VPKSRLVEKIAALLEERKLPLLADIRDESTEKVRLILEPKTRNVDPTVLMESLFRASELETRIPLNMNVLDAQGVPRVMDLKEVLQSFLDHRRTVLQRVTRFRLAEIARRSEVLRGQMIVYLNLDEVIRIIREHDDAKERMIKRWKLSEIQVEAILNTRLRALRKLEEMEIKRELKALGEEEKDLKGLLDDDKRQWKAIAAEVADIKKAFGGGPLGKRRSEIGTPPAAVVVPLEALVEREPVTVLCSAKGWIRAAKGHNLPRGEIKYKEGDEEGFVIELSTTDKLLIFATSGRFYTLPVEKLPGGRGHGEPLRLMIDLPNEHEVAAIVTYAPAAKLLLASSDGRGFIVPADEVLGQTRNGKVVMTPGEDAKASVCTVAAGDSVAVVGTNRKLLIFPLSEVPEMARGRGVILQRYHDGELSDAKVFNRADGLSWKRGDGTRTESDLRAWIGARASSGRVAPNGFAKNNRFG
jgi:topoisomerase IV subunit A